LFGDLSAWLKPRREQLDHAMGQLFADCWPSDFREPLQYALLGGGKRVRPAILMGAFESIAGPEAEISSALPAAMAVEMIHSYSLVHDDLPAMDDDDERRGRPTVHVAFGESTAILVGDTLLTEAFSLLASGSWSSEIRVALIKTLADAAGYRGMVGGQVADTGAGPDISQANLQRLHAGKTGALIRASAIMGGLVAGAESGEIAALTSYGEAIGMAFQLADDVLDSDEDAAEGGPPSYVKLLGKEETTRQAVEYAEKAIRAIEDLRSPEMLTELARFTVQRTV
jgi:geranylgeranyl diphosphate synthase, type II